MWINIIDYRGDNTIISSNNTTLFNFRTRYFFRMQDDFAIWKRSGHKFRCFTQHQNRNQFVNDYWAFDDVVPIPRGNAAHSRNCVLDFYNQGEWTGIWDNDATLYFDKLLSDKFVQELESICLLAQQQNIFGIVPFNAQQSPYPKTIPKDWTFKPQFLKGTMMFLHVTQERFDEQKILTIDDIEYSARLALQGKKFAQCPQASLKELVMGKSTVFMVNAYHSAYKNPGPNANPQGLIKWDAQLDRKDQYAISNTYIEQKLGLTMQEIKKQHLKLWKQI